MSPLGSANRSPPRGNFYRSWHEKIPDLYLDLKGGGFADGQEPSANEILRDDGD